MQESSLSDILSAIKSDPDLATWEKEKMCAEVVHNYKQEYTPSFSKPSAKTLDAFIYFQTSKEKKAEDDKRAKEAREAVEVKVYVGNKLQPAVLRDKKGRIIQRLGSNNNPSTKKKVAPPSAPKKVKGGKLDLSSGVLYI